jgi:hypothetical protein
VSPPTPRVSPFKPDLKPSAFRSSAVVRLHAGVLDASHEIAHKWFDAHAANFSPGLQKLLDAHATLATFGFELLPSVRANVPPELVQPPRPRRAPSRPLRSVAPSPVVFDVAILFAGPQRTIAEAIATKVRDAGFEVFYDAFYPEQLWGKDLAVFFDDVFRRKSRYCVIIVSKDCVERDWNNHERQSAVARAIKERGREYILPVKADDGIELPGVADTVGYVSLGQYSIEKIVEMLIAKLGAQAGALARGTPLGGGDPSSPLSLARQLERVYFRRVPDKPQRRGRGTRGLQRLQTALFYTPAF